MKKNRSLFTNDFNTCYFTGATSNIEDHHIFGGANRGNSEQYGMVIPLEHTLHNEPPFGVHHNAKLDLALKQFAQRTFENMGHTRTEFTLIFGKNWLYSDDDGYEVNLRALGVPVYEG